MRISRIAVVALAVAGCGGSEYVLTADERERLPHEGKVALYDAENDVVIARSRRDEASAHLTALKRDIDSDGRRWKRISSALSKSAPQKIDPAKRAVTARRDYLDSEVSISQANIRTADAEIDAALARLGQVRQRQLVRSGRALIGTIAPWDEKVKVLERRAREVQRKELDLRTEAQKVYEKWKAQEDDYARTTGDFDAIVWAE
jgi:hypothetical protein